MAQCSKKEMSIGGRSHQCPDEGTHAYSYLLDGEEEVSNPLCLEHVTQEIERAHRKGDWSVEMFELEGAA